ncbi:MAG: hypothetical protein ACD_41C00038G0006 [uncultured bacterium]|nr:MAG: hypothetical protein ACD_41C00038G0006 [uncultured bacterium]HBY73580.1 DNA primase [Candidatus Kerfeldbacteria bacterium]
MADAVIEQIKQRVDIIELLSEYLKLQKAGSNWRALCPFHHENSPSFMVSQDKQIWHCFGCDKGGDIFTFLQEIEGVDFPEALRLLAQRANVTLTQYNPSAQEKKQLLLDLVSKAQKFYTQALQESKEAESARQYIQQRGLSAESIAAFGIGYSYDDWSRLKDYLTSQGAPEANLIEAGLVINHYDRFRGRLMIPLHDANGTIVGFTARTLKRDEPGGKYINSPQSIIYDKSQVVFGLWRAKAAIRKLNAALVVEGNLDAITAQQHGFTNAVATSGTAFTAGQLLQLKRYSPNLLLAFDLDVAGEQAAERGIDLALQYNMNIKIVRWPSQYKDPDECIRADAAAFMAAIRQAISIMDYWFWHAQQGLQLERVEHKKVLVQRLLPKLKKVADTVEVSHYLQKLADLVRVDAGLLQEQLNKLKDGKSNVMRLPSAISHQPSATRMDRSTRLVEHILGLVLTMPEQFAYARDYLDSAFIADSTLVELYRRMLDQYNKSGQFAEDAADVALVGKLRLQVDHDFPDSSIADRQAALVRAIQELRKRYIEQRLRDLQVELKQAEANSDDTLMNQLVDEVKLLTQQLTELSR